VGTAPAAWIDEDLDTETRLWADHRHAPTLLIERDPAIGLTRDHIRQLVTFSDVHAA
jgi:hypothetical protein